MKWLTPGSGSSGRWPRPGCAATAPDQPAHPRRSRRGGWWGRSPRAAPPEPPPMAATRAAAAAERPGVEQERHRGGGREQQPAQWRGDQLVVGHHVGAQEAAASALASASLGTTAGRIETAALSNRASAVPRAKKTAYSRGRVAASASTATPSRPMATARAASTRSPAGGIQPVDQRPADQREQQPREPLGHGQAGHQPRVAGQGRGQQGPGDQGDSRRRGWRRRYVRWDPGEVGPRPRCAQVGSLVPEGMAHDTPPGDAREGGPRDETALYDVRRLPLLGRAPGRRHPGRGRRLRPGQPPTARPHPGPGAAGTPASGAAGTPAPGPQGPRLGWDGGEGWGDGGGAEVQGGASSGGGVRPVPGAVVVAGRVSVGRGTCGCCGWTTGGWTGGSTGVS